MPLNINYISEKGPRHVKARFVRPAAVVLWGTEFASEITSFRSIEFDYLIKMVSKATGSKTF